MAKSHVCLDGERVDTPGWWVYDGQGIPLTRVCGRCEKQKLAKYRPEILEPYTQADVDERIDED